LSAFAGSRVRTVTPSICQTIWAGVHSIVYFFQLVWLLASAWNAPRLYEVVCPLPKLNESQYIYFIQCAHFYLLIALNLVRICAKPLPVDLVQSVRLEDKATDNASARCCLGRELNLAKHDVPFRCELRRIT
jgi:hypothetical protein